MKALKIFVVTILIALASGNASAAGFVTNLSPAEFSARYTACVQYMIESLAEHAATDYSYFLIKDVFKDKEHNTYFAYINEDYDNKQMNAIVMFAQEKANFGGIEVVGIIAEENVPDRENKLLLETVTSLIAMDLRGGDVDEIQKIIKASAGTYKFHDTKFGKNIYISAENFGVKIYTD